MTRGTQHRLALTAAALVVVTAVAACAQAQENIDRSLPAAPDGTVTIKNLAGSITVEGWAEAKVSVTGTLGDGTERLDVTGEGRRTIVEVVLPRHARHVEGSELLIRVPKGSRVEVEAVSATVEVTDCHGRARSAGHQRRHHRARRRPRSHRPDGQRDDRRSRRRAPGSRPNRSAATSRSKASAATSRFPPSAVTSR